MTISDNQISSQSIQIVTVDSPHHSIDIFLCEESLFRGQLFLPIN